MTTTTYLVVMLVAYVISILVKCYHITQNNYPRMVDYSIGEDLFGLLLMIGMLVWVILLLV